MQSESVSADAKGRLPSAEAYRLLPGQYAKRLASETAHSDDDAPAIACFGTKVKDWRLRDDDKGKGFGKRGRVGRGHWGMTKLSYCRRCKKTIALDRIPWCQFCEDNVV